MNVRIQQNYRINIESVEKLMDMKARSGESMNSMVNEAISNYLERRTVAVADPIDDPEKGDPVGK